MWILLGPVIVFVVMMVAGAVNQFVVAIVLGGLLLGTLWQILQELVRLRHAYEEQTRALRGHPSRLAPTNDGEQST